MHIQYVFNLPAQNSCEYNDCFCCALIGQCLVAWETTAQPPDFEMTLHVGKPWVYYIAVTKKWHCVNITKKWCRRVVFGGWALRIIKLYYITNKWDAYWGVREVTGLLLQRNDAFIGVRFEVTLTTLKYFERVFFNLKSSLDLSASFIYLCYWSVCIKNVSIFWMRVPSLYRFWRIKTVPALKGLDT